MSTGAQTVDKAREKAFSTINKRSFLTVVILLVSIIVLSGALSYFIPQGAFERDPDGAIIAGSYVPGEVDGIAIWRVITAPFRVFVSEDALTIIMISIFLLIMSGVFNLLEKTDGIKIIIAKTVKRFSTHKRAIIFVMTFVFMLFGSFFGMFEELVTLLPLVIVLMLSLGYDTLTGLGVCMMAACFGFSAAITNPFSVGLAASFAGTHVLDGAWLRIIFFIIVYLGVCGFVMLHTKRISADPKRSLTYEIDQRKKQSMNLSVLEDFTAEDNRKFKVYAIFFLVQLVLLVAIASIRAISGLAIPLLSVSFLVGGIVAGCLVSESKKAVFRHILVGASAMLPAVVMIALASSVKLIMVESGIMDTVMNAVITSLAGKSPFLCIVLIYLLILFLQLFIGSASAKIMLIMPIIVPVTAALGLSPTVVILTYCIADGFTDVILPTNPVLLIGLSIANVSYGKWLKWTWKVQLVLFVFTILFLLFAIGIGY